MNEDKLQSAIDEAKESVDAMTDKAEEIADETADKAEEAGDDFRDALSNFSAALDRLGHATEKRRARSGPRASRKLTAPSAR